jgi:hypothetical protein
VLGLPSRADPGTLTAALGAETLHGSQRNSAAGLPPAAGPGTQITELSIITARTSRCPARSPTYVRAAPGRSLTTTASSSLPLVDSHHAPFPKRNTICCNTATFRGTTARSGSSGLFLIFAGPFPGVRAGLMPGCRPGFAGSSSGVRGRRAVVKGNAGRARRRVRTSASRPQPSGSRRISVPAWRTSRAGMAMRQRSAIEPESIVQVPRGSRSSVPGDGPPWR